MENNKFEKQVQEKLSELSIQPSEKAWTGIESRIRKKDTSRRILWFLLIGFFLLAGGGYFLLKDGEVADKKIAQKSTINGKAEVQEQPVNSGSSLNTFTEKPPVALTESQKSSIPTEERTMINTSDPIISFTDTHLNVQERETVMQEPVAKEKIIIQVESGMTDIINEAKIKRISSVTPQGINQIKSTPETDSVLKSTDVHIRDVASTLPLNERCYKEVSPERQTVNPEIKKEEEIAREGSDLMKGLNLEEKKTNSSSHKSWEIGMTFSASKVILGKGIQLGMELDKSGPANDPVNFENNYYLYPGSNMSQTVIGPPSSPKNSYGFNAGIVFKKELSPKVSFVTGLGYTYFTNSLLVGKQTPSGNYNSAGVLSPYRNNFHFVELPLSAQFHLNRKHKIPLDLSIGLNISQFLSSNAFQYKGGFYGVDNSVFTKTQVGFNAGFSATFFRNIAIGPFYQYGLNSLAKEGLYGKKHLNFLGVKADFSFGKNK